MGHRYFWQPDGKIAIWSTVVDEFVIFDMSIRDFMDREILNAVDRLDFQVLMRATNPPNIYEMEEDEKKSWKKLQDDPDEHIIQTKTARERSHEYVDQAFDRIDKIMEKSKINMEERPFFEKDVIKAMVNEHLSQRG